MWADWFDILANEFLAATGIGLSNQNFTIHAGWDYRNITLAEAAFVFARTAAFVAGSETYSAGRVAFIAFRCVNSWTGDEFVFVTDRTFRNDMAWAAFIAFMREGCNYFTRASHWHFALNILNQYGLALIHDLLTLVLLTLLAIILPPRGSLYFEFSLDYTTVANILATFLNWTVAFFDGLQLVSLRAFSIWAVTLVHWARVGFIKTNALEIAAGSTCWRWSRFANNILATALVFNFHSIVARFACFDLDIRTFSLNAFESARAATFGSFE